MVLLKLNAILGYAIVAFLLSLWIYPHYIYRLKSIKAGKQIREMDGSGQPATIFASLHAAKK
jgi:ABC-type glycerol-3-phosphate transport system permease component